MDTPRTDSRITESPRTEQRRNERLTVIDEWLDQGFAWISENAVWTVALLGGAIVTVGTWAAVHEFRLSREASAQTALAVVDRELEAAFEPGSEPANPDTAKQLREKSLAGYEKVIQDHEGRFGAQLAEIHAASLEIDLERFDAADKRLAAAIAAWPDDSVQRAVALRLRGYALERLQRPAEAAEAYAQAAAVTAYPGRAGAYVQAGETFARLGNNERAIAAYDALSLLDPGFAERYGVQERLEGLRGAMPSSATKPVNGAPAAAPAAAEAPAAGAAPETPAPAAPATKSGS